MAATGWMAPVTLEAWVTAMSRVFLRSAPRTSSGSMKPSGRGGSNVSSISSRRSFSASTRRTELCSSSVEMTWSPVRSAPLMARLSASVQLKAKATQKGSRRPKHGGDRLPGGEYRAGGLQRAGDAPSAPDWR